MEQVATTQQIATGTQNRCFGLLRLLHLGKVTNKYSNYTLSSRGVHVPSTISTCTQHVSGDRFLHACNNETHGTQTYCSTLHVYMSICMQADVCTTCSV